MLFFIPASKSAFIFITSGIEAVFTCAIIDFLSFKAIAFASIFKISSIVNELKSVPAFNISSPYSFISIPAILPNSSNASSSKCFLG